MRFVVKADCTFTDDIPAEPTLKFLIGLEAVPPPFTSTDRLSAGDDRAFMHSTDTFGTRRASSLSHGAAFRNGHKKAFKS
jgi:hypothetical protein